MEREKGFEPTTLCLGSGPLHRTPQTPCLQGISRDLAPSTMARQRVAVGTSFRFGRSVTSLDLAFHDRIAGDSPALPRMTLAVALTNGRSRRASSCSQRLRQAAERDQTSPASSAVPSVRVVPPLPLLPFGRKDRVLCRVNRPSRRFCSGRSQVKLTPLGSRGDTWARCSPGPIYVCVSHLVSSGTRSPS